MYNTHKGVEEMEIHYKRGDKNSVAYIVGEVDHHNAKTARESIDKRIAEYGSECFGLDLSGVTFCDSSGLGLVMGRMKKCAEWTETKTLVSHFIKERVCIGNHH